jgi:hypothetical protein
MTDNALLDQLAGARMALEGYWAAWAVERNRPDAASGATMCRFTSAFLVLVLGWQWEMSGGEPTYPGETAGFFDGEAWHAHYWVTDGERIVDLTANQFGQAPIIVTSTADERYSENCSEDELGEALYHVMQRARQWADDFTSKRVASFAEN